LKISMIKLFDKIFGSFVNKILFAPSLSLPTAFNHFLIIRPGGIGDAVMLIPMIYSIKRTYPMAEITVLAEKRNSSVFLLCPLLDNLIHYDKPMEMIRVFRQHYDVVIDTEQWHYLSAIVTRLLRAPMSIGFATNERKKLFTHQISYSHDAYESDSFLKLLEPLNIPESAATQPPYLLIPEAAQKKGVNLLADLKGKPFVVIFPGASISERHWGVDRFRKVTEKINSLKIPVVVVGGNEDASDGKSIVDGNFGQNIAGKTSLVETAAVIEKSSVLVSGDSGILHIGVGLGKPTVSLFGPGIAKKWAPRGDRHIVLNKGLTCSPCTRFGYTPRCPINAKCMADITVEDVVAAIEKLFRKFPRET
jgi:ADP-heptose:LPS heptosyltransferase